MRLPCPGPVVAILGLLMCGGCGDDAPASDASPADAGPDAFNPCGDGKVQFTGEYVDWDSTDVEFHGVAGAAVAVVGDADTTATTAPNGRSILCLPAAAGSVVTYSHDDYLPARYTVAPAAAALGPYSARGLALKRVDGFFVDLDAVREPDAAQVLVEVRSYPSYVPVVGATVTLSGGEASYTQDGGGAWVSGDTLVAGGGAHVLIINVPVDEPVAVTVEAPGSRTCVGPGAIQVEASELAFTTFACADL